MARTTCVSLGNLKKRYNKAIEENEESFKIGDAELFTSYAKFLIEYAEDTRKLKDRDFLDLIPCE